MESLGIAIALALGLFVGNYIKNIKDRVTILENKKPEVGATTGNYGKINEYNVNQPGETGLVMPKTPQQLEYEEAERLRQAQHDVVVKPRE